VSCVTISVTILAPLRSLVSAAIRAAMRKLPENLKKWTEPERKMLVGYLWGTFFTETTGNYGAAHGCIVSTLNAMLVDGVPIEYREQVELVQRYVWGMYGKSMFEKSERNEE
jgi:hypothetical protein